MKLNPIGLGLAAGILWSLALFLTGIANLLWEGYGLPFLQLMASVYPGYKAGRSVGDLIVGSLYALLDGGICGLVFAWLYNMFSGKSRPA